jgi:hypothetical protein
MGSDLENQPVIIQETPVAKPTAEQLTEALRDTYRTREAVLAVFPHAVFMPWDEPPIGTRIRVDLCKDSDHGVIVGRYEGWREHPHAADVMRHCSSARCSCPGVPSAMFGRWIIQPDTGGPQELHYPPYLQLEDGQ